MKQLMMIIHFLCSLHLLQQSLSLGQVDDCTPWKCQQNGPIIEFPFRLQAKLPEYCGYPGFEVTCSNGDTILQLPSVGELSVLDISYSKQSIKVQENCLAEFILGFDGSNISSSTSSSPFHYSCSTRNYTFFDCPTDITSNTNNFYQVPCLSNKSHTVGFIGLSSDLASSPKSCNIMETVAVPIVPYDDIYGCTNVPSSFDYPNYLKYYSTVWVKYLDVTAAM